MASAREHVVTLLTDKFRVRPDRIDDEATLTEIGLDSLNAAELHVKLQGLWAAYSLKGEITPTMTLRQVVAIAEAWQQGRDALVAGP